MKTHLAFMGCKKLVFLSLITMFFSVFSFSQTVTTGDDWGGKYVILTKYTSNGEVDSSYGINGSTIQIRINYFADFILPDGKVLIIGNTRDVYVGTDIHWDIRLARVNTDGTLDPSFGDNGILTLDSQPLRYEEITSVELVQGRIFIAYTSTSIVGQNKSLDVFIYNINTNNFKSIVFQSFDYFDDTPPPLKILPYGSNKFLVATGATIYMFNEDDQPDPSFNGTGQLNLPPVPGGSTVINDLIVHNGKIIAGATSSDPNMTVFKVYIFNSDGSPDTSFGDQGVQTVPISGPQLQQMYVDGSTLFIVTPSAVYSYPLNNTPPATFTCPAGKVASTDPGQCSAVVNDIDPVITPAGSNLQINYVLSGATSGAGQGTASGKTFNAGITTVTYSLNADPTATCSFTVEVRDTQAPVIAAALPQTSVLWPPNHQMIDLEIDYLLMDNCGATASLSVTSNEPQSGTGSGDQPVDWEILDAHHLRLRAERSGKGTGRIYTITITAVDAAGNTTTKQVLVTVPHDASSKQDLKIKAFPNPFSSSFQVFIESKKTERVIIKITDANGRIVESRVQVVPNSTVQLGTDYKPGLYLVEVSQGKLRQTLQVIKVQGPSGKVVILP
jgi:uncharacterized delta-60 repeat protein